MEFAVDIDTQRYQRRNHQGECDQEGKQLTVFLHVHDDAPLRAGAEAGCAGAAGVVLRPPKEGRRPPGEAVGTAGLLCTAGLCDGVGAEGLVDGAGAGTETTPEAGCTVGAEAVVTGPDAGTAKGADVTAGAEASLAGCLKGLANWML